MNFALKDLLVKINFGTPLVYKNLTIVPIFHKNGNKLKYSSLSDAIKKHEVEITEVNESGRVPELLVKNKSDNMVLIVDGEQFVGAKQNRIINASILIDKNIETVINVSCVEQGRWSYKSKHFSDSENLLNHDIRYKKMMSVNKSLKFAKDFSADQGQIWDGVETFMRRSAHHSPTSSMDDVYKSSENRLKEFIDAFVPQPKQKGVVVFINGEAVAFEFISNEKVFRKNMEKIIRSYSSEAILRKEKKISTDYIDVSHKFINSIADAEESQFKSMGLGDDIRYEYKNLVASALVHEDEVVHFVGFRVDKAGDEKRMGMNRPPFIREF